VKSILGDFADPKYYHLACDIATYHHEHWDGSGYPEGLSGEEIPVSARIMAIADVYDALVARRAYKDSMTSADAFEIIESEAGSHFDPELVQIFVKSESEIKGVMYEKR
jgi:putative two-component system response regulator